MATTDQKNTVQFKHKKIQSIKTSGLSSLYTVHKLYVNHFVSYNPTGIYLFTDNNGNARAMCEIC